MSLEDDVVVAFRASVTAVDLAEAVLATVPAENKTLHRLARKAIRQMRVVRKEEQNGK